MDQIVALLQNEISRLQASLEREPDPRVLKIKALEYALSLYIPPSDTAPARLSQPSRRRPPVRKPAPETQRALDAAANFLRGKTVPISSTLIYRYIAENNGCRLGGQRPANNLSAAMGRAGGRFQAHGKKGWTLGPSTPSVAIGGGMGGMSILVDGNFETTVGRSLVEPADEELGA